MSEKAPKSVSRRSFIKGASLATAGFMIVPRHVLGGPRFVAPSDKVNIALVGAGGRGLQNAQDLMRLDDVQITAIADPAEYWDLNRFYYRTVAGRGPGKDMVEEHYEAKTPNFKVSEYTDFREMLEKESSLDAILCATPDHTHAYIFLMAMRAVK
ncbi:MAG: twin-arginine translocation signal domain-containing protein, partial [Bacteroidetes bacterium]|nr:twin-arginine translocation signal domain-containing protein [Bacteroidota bacterium]